MPRITEPRPSTDNADRRQPIERSGGRRRDRRTHACRRLSDPPISADKALLAQVFRPGSPYEQLADKLITNSAWRRWGRSHWLCIQLKDAAESLDPDLFAKQAGQSVRNGLRAIGFPRYMADALGAGSGATVKIAFGTTSADSLSKLLRVLIPLVCPDFARCPVESAVVDALVTPAVSDEVRAMVQS